MNARVDDMLGQPEVEVKSVREKIWAFKESQMRLGDAKGIIVGNVYIKFEEYLREGYGDGAERGPSVYSKQEELSRRLSFHGENIREKMCQRIA